MSGPLANPVVHLELRTANLSRACAFYTELFDWRTESVRVGEATYLALEFATGMRGGVVERESDESAWLPYVEVPNLMATTRRARELGATVAMEPREGSAGWRSVLEVPAGAEIALWQPKR